MKFPHNCGGGLTSSDSIQNSKYNLLCRYLFGCAYQYFLVMYGKIENWMKY